METAIYLQVWAAIGWCIVTIILGVLYGLTGYLASKTLKRLVHVHGQYKVRAWLDEWKHCGGMPDIESGSYVIVYDRYRFAIPLPAIVRNFSSTNDGVEVELLKSNNPDFPIGCLTWVHKSQLRLDKDGI